VCPTLWRNDLRHYNCLTLGIRNGALIWEGPVAIVSVHLDRLSSQVNKLLLFNIGITAVP